MKGRRVYPDEKGEMCFAPGDYGFDPRESVKRWFARAPDQDVHVGDLSLHTVVEHEDGTITVSPSILTNPPGPYHHPGFKTWHGYLERGEWREC
jgi:hypothetical protein